MSGNIIQLLEGYPIKDTAVTIDETHPMISTKETKNMFSVCSFLSMLINAVCVIISLAMSLLGVMTSSRTTFMAMP